MLIISHILFTIPIIVIGFVYSYILTMPGMILNGWYKLLANAPDWLFYPLIFCEKCVCGQLALWLYPFVITRLMNIHYNPFLHIWYITQSILGVVVLKSIYETYIVPVKLPEYKAPPIDGFKPLKPKTDD